MFQPGDLALAEMIGFAGPSTEIVRIVRILDEDTVLVRVQSSLSTPVELRALKTPIPTSRILRRVGILAEIGLPGLILLQPLSTPRSPPGGLPFAG